MMWLLKQKHDLDLVTNIDKEVQADFTKFIEENYPEHQIMGEEKVTVK